MAVQDVIPLAFGDVFPHGAFVSGEVKPARDWDRSTAGSEVQLEVETLDPETGEVARVPVWLVVIHDPEGDQTVQVQIVARRQPVLPPTVPGTPFRAVELDGLAVEPYLNRDKCKAPWGGRQHRCGARLAYKYWATDLHAPTTSGAAAKTGAGNGQAKS